MPPYYLELKVDRREIVSILPFVVGIVRYSQAMFSFWFQGKEGADAEKMALANPDRFVLKPQREGGGKIVKIHW